MSQRGQTLVELLVGMAVTALILGSLTGVLYTVGSHSLAWATRVDEASAGDALTAALQADAHRYPCVASSAGGTLLTLSAPQASSTGGMLLTLSSPLANPGFTYSSRRSEDNTWRVARGPASDPGRGALVDRLPGQPTFTVSPPIITIQVVPRLKSRGSLVVYYPPPPKGYCS